MDYNKIIDKHDEFEKNSKVISTNEDVKVRRTYIEDEDVTLNNDEKTQTVERQVKVSSRKMSVSESKQPRMQ